MGFDARQDRRRVVLERVMLAAQALAVVWLSAHALITWRAWESDGFLAALLTLVLLGFGDLYWGLRWGYEGDWWIAGVALAAAAVCFVSWAVRPMFNRWIGSLTVEMLEDFSDELGRMAKDREAEDAVEIPPDGDGKELPPNSDEPPPRE